MGVLELITISILSFVSGFLVAFLLRIRVEIENFHSEPDRKSVV